MGRMHTCFERSGVQDHEKVYGQVADALREVRGGVERDMGRAFQVARD